MGDLHNMEKIKVSGHASGQMTGQQLADKLKKSPDAMRKYFVRVAEKRPDIFSDTSWSLDRTLTAEQVAALSGQKQRTKKSSFNPQRQSTPPAPDKTGDGNSARNFSETVGVVRHFAVGAVLVAVVICHAALVWYDCAHLYGWAGVIGGAAVFLIVLAAVLLAADREKYSTSEAALWFVFVVDCAAWWVHFPVFDTPDVSSRVTGFLCGFLCAASWVALYLFRNYKLEQ